MSTKMYEPFQVKGVKIKNRLIKSAMFEFGAENGRLTPRIAELYETAAKGGIGMIITGMQAVSKGGGIGPAMVQTTYDGYIENMSEIANKIHQYDCKDMVQLQHAGHRTWWKGGYDTFAVTDTPVSDEFSYHCATPEELSQVAADFGAAAKKCKLAGCDGVQIHAAHGFLINSFLSPHTNKRTDHYGGPIENRAKLLFEIYSSIRKATGNDFLIGVKIPFSDLTEDTSTSEDMVWVCRELENMGIDMIEVSSGMTPDGSDASFTPHRKKNSPEGTFLDGAVRIATEVKVPVISVCGYRTPEFIEETLKTTGIAAVSLGRPLVREPGLPERWKTDRSPAQCISCNRCYGSEHIITCLAAKQ